MKLIEIFHLVLHSSEIMLSMLIVFSTYYAIKKFKLAIWRRGWHLIGLGFFIFMLIEIIELLELFNYLKESVQFTILMHSTHLAGFIFIVLGILLLSNATSKIFGK